MLTDNSFHAPHIGFENFNVSLQLAEAFVYLVKTGINPDEILLNGQGIRLKGLFKCRK